jgi:hypothetical protein
MTNEKNTLVPMNKNRMSPGLCDPRDFIIMEADESAAPKIARLNVTKRIESDYVYGPRSCAQSSIGLSKETRSAKHGEPLKTDCKSRR